MKLSELEKKQLRDMFNYSVFIQSFAVMADFAIQKDKKEMIKRIERFISEFLKSLTPEEKAQFDDAMQAMIDERSKIAMNTLAEDVSAEEVEDFMQSLDSVTFTPLSQEIIEKIAAPK